VLLVQSGKVFNGSLISLAEASDSTVLGPGNDGKVHRMYADGSTQVFYASSSCTAVVQMPNGNMAVLDSTGAKVTEVNAATGAKVADRAFGAPGSINLGLGPDNAFYTAVFDGGSVHRAEPGGSFVVKIVKPVAGKTVEGMTVLPNGDVLLGNLSSASVDRVAAQGWQYQGPVATGVSGGTRSLQLAPNGNVYVAGSETMYRLAFPEK
jgi:hypothetical protein